MTFSAGTRLGSYEIVAAIGAGGIGEVYKAKDTRGSGPAMMRMDHFVAEGKKEETLGVW